MGEYPDGMRRLRINMDLQGSERTGLVDVPAEWAGWTDDARRHWARERCAEETAKYVDVTWSDADDAGSGPFGWPTSWDAATGDQVE